MKRVEIYDTTLRDGTQGEGISFSAEEKVKIAQELDKFGMAYIEGGWPGSNQRDVAFFNLIRNVRLKHALVAAFGSTRRADSEAHNDPNLKALIDAHTPVTTIFGKTWDLHVKEGLRVSPQENLAMIEDSVRYLKSKGKKVIYDAEHFYDGFRTNPEYAAKTLEVARDAGAEVLVLCDTNGGTLPSRVLETTKAVMKLVPFEKYGIHSHNDSDLAVANAVAAVEAGCMHVQGTMNGYGERVGNCNLCSTIPNLQIKLGHRCVPERNLRELTRLSRYVNEVANQVPNHRAAFVGDSAFAHKGGIHVSAVMKNNKMYEHMEPELVGNRRRVLISDLSGRSNLLAKAGEFELDFTESPEKVKEIIADLKKREHAGYLYEDAEGSFEILARRLQGKFKEYFNLAGYRVITEKKLDQKPYCEATIKLSVDGDFEHAACEGDGPVNALDGAIRKALEKFYPELKKMQLTDYKVRVLEGSEATAAKVRVHIESRGKEATWSTVGVSENIIEASWEALVDSISYFLFKEKSEPRKPKAKKVKQVPKKA